MTIEIVGTRAPEISPTSSWVEDLPSDTYGVALISAYWDQHAGDLATAISEKLRDGPVKLLLWVNGGSGFEAWERLRRIHSDDNIDIRFVNNPERGGIFHIKAWAAFDEALVWRRAYLGSANLTRNGYARNLELGAVFDDPTATLQLQEWFETVWAEAVPFTDELFASAAPVARENSKISRSASQNQSNIKTRLVPAPPSSSPDTGVIEAPPIRRHVHTQIQRRWWKRMSRSDAAQYSARANPQSMITMTRVAGSIEDPDAAFLNDFFVEAWEEDPDKDGRKKLEISAHLTILGTPRGRHSVSFTWDAERRERQHGPATHLHLMPHLEPIFQEQDLTGMYIVLTYENETYSIEIMEQHP